jgi:methionyl aminopeptidase
MIELKTKHQIELMREAGRVSANALRAAGAAVVPGATTAEIDAAAKEYILSQGAKPSFLGYNGFPATACISVNNEVIHGIPGHRKIQNGDIVSIDVGAILSGYHGDNAATFAAGDISPAAQKLLTATQQSLMAGIKAAVAGARLGDVGSTIAQFVEAQGFSVVRQYVGHGIGREMHMEPDVPNYGRPGRGIRLVPGMTIAIEPMVNEGTYQVKTQSNGWTVVTMDGKLSAHFEHTIAITSDGPMILTLP